MAWTLYMSSAYAQTKVGDNPLVIDTASILELESTSKGFLPSRLTTVQRDAQTEWKQGHIIYNTTETCLQIYDGTTWACFVRGELVDSTIYKYDGTLTNDRTVTLGTNSLTFSGTDVNVAFESTGELGIGTASPDAHLHIVESTGTSADATNGTIILEHENAGGSSSLVFKSTFDATDFGYIEYRDGASGAGILEIGAVGESSGAAIDNIALMPSGNLGIGTVTPIRKLQVDGGAVRFSNYGTGAELGTPTYLLGVDADGDVKDVDISTIGSDDQTIDELSLNETTGVLSISLEDDGEAAQIVDLSSLDSNLYNANGLLESARTVGLNGNALTFDGPGGDDVIIQGDGDLALGAQLLDESGSAGTPGQVLSTTATGTDWVDAATDTDDQGIDVLGFDGTEISISLDDDGEPTQTLDISSVDTDTDDQGVDQLTLDGSNNLIISLDDNATTDQVDLSRLAESIYNTSDTLNGARRVTLDGNALTFDGPGGDDVIIQGDGDLALGAQLLDESGSAGTPGQVLSTTATGTDWVDAATDTDDQGIDVLGFDGTQISISLDDDGEPTQTLDISSVDTDTDDQGIDVLGFDGTEISISLDDDGEPTQTLDISSVNTDDQNLLTPTLTGTTLNLNIEDGAGTSIDLAPILGSSDNIYSTNGTLAADRTVTMGNRFLNFTGSDDQVRIHSDGDLSIGTTTANGDINAVSNQNQDAFHFTQQDGLTSERDVFTIEDQDVGGGGQDGSSVLKVVKSADISTGDDGFSLVELASTGAGTDPGDNKYWISGRKTDEGAPEWGVDITDNDYWSTGGIVLGVNTTNANGTYTRSSGTFVVEDDGSTGIGTMTPDEELHVAGDMRLDGAFEDKDGDRGTAGQVLSSTVSGTDWIDPPSGDNIYTSNGSLAGNRTVNTNNNSLTFNSTSGGDIIIQADGDMGIGTTSPSDRLDVAGGTVRFRNYGQGTAALNDTSVNYILTVDENGDVRELNTAKNTRWFYAPAVTIDASNTGTGLTIDLYQQYKDQFTMPDVRSPGAPLTLPIYDVGDLFYYVSFYDDNVLSNVSIDASGVMTYDVIDVPFDNYTIVNVIFLIE